MTIDAIRGRHERGVGWVPGKHAMDQVLTDVYDLLAEVERLTAERDRARATAVALEQELAQAIEWGEQR